MSGPFSVQPVIVPEPVLTLVTARDVVREAVAGVGATDGEGVASDVGVGDAASWVATVGTGSTVGVGDGSSGIAVGVGAIVGATVGWTTTGAAVGSCTIGASVGSWTTGSCWTGGAS